MEIKQTLVANIQEAMSRWSIQSRVLYDMICEHHEWDFVIPEGCDILEWRRKQLKLYHEKLPEVKPSGVMQWLSEQNPHPWPECTRDMVK